MTWGYVAVGAATLISGYMGSQSQKNAAKSASGAQSSAAQAQIDEARREFDAIRELLAPYSQAGTKSLGAQQDLLGLSGPNAQKAAIAALESGPQMKALQRQGENAILQNAAATGGLRGGNTAAALATFRPQLLNQLINQQFGNLGGLTAIGQNAAAGTGNAGMQTSIQIQSALGQQGAALAGNALAGGQANANMWSSLGSTASMLGLMQGFGNQSTTPTKPIRGVF